MFIRCKRWNGVVILHCAQVVASVFILCSPVCAQIIVDDFIDTGDVIFPLKAEYPAFAILGGFGPVDGVFAGTRHISAQFGANGPPLNPVPADSSLSIDIDPTLGVLHVDAGADATIQFNIGWQSMLSTGFADVDVTKHPKLLVVYSSSVDLDMSIVLANQTSPSLGSFPILSAVTSAASQQDTLLPAAASGRFIINIADIADPLGNPPFPMVDLTSLDSVAFGLSTDQRGQGFSLHKIAFVPAPSTPISMLLGLATLLLIPRWPLQLA
jgi:hypothetical protein